MASMALCYRRQGGLRTARFVKRGHKSSVTSHVYSNNPCVLAMLYPPVRNHDVMYHNLIRNHLIDGVAVLGCDQGIWSK